MRRDDARLFCKLKHASAAALLMSLILFILKSSVFSFIYSFELPFTPLIVTFWFFLLASVYHLPSVSSVRTVTHYTNTSSESHSLAV